MNVIALVLRASVTFAASFPGPLMFHPRGMGPRGMRPGMRPPFAPRGPPFDPREADAFFRPSFDDMRGRPGPHIRPPFGPMGPPAMHGPDGPWRNQESGGPPPASWPGQESDGHGQRENHLSRDKQKVTKHQDYKNISERENRNRNRKSRWGNVSPPLTDDVDEILPSEETESKTGISDSGEQEPKDSFDASSSAVDQQSFLIPREQNESAAAQEQDAMQGDRENELPNIPNNEGINEVGYEDQANSYEIGADHFSSDDLALKQRVEEQQCEYEALIPAEDSAQHSAVQSVEQTECTSENYSEQLVEQQVDSL